jgi:alcohol dehydrogenase
MVRTRNRPRGALRHYGGLLTPRGNTAVRATSERATRQRLQRLARAAADAAAQRRRPTRPRMRALTVSPGCRLRWASVPEPPPPGPDGAIVRPLAVATCDLDPLIALGATPFPLPLHLGHECVAEVVRTGERVTGITAGQRVVVPFQISCGSCPPCQAGNTANCLSVPPVSMYGFGVAGGHWGGAYSELLAVPYADAMLVPLPPGIDPATAASVADNVCDGYRHVAPHLPALLEADAGAEVLIVGSISRHTPFSGSVPLYAGLVARALGARRVTLADARPAVAAHAERLGLEVVPVRDLKRRPPAPLVVEISAHPAGLRLAVARTAPDGVCSSGGSLHRRGSLPLLAMYARNVTLHVGRTHARAVIPDVLALIGAGRLHPETVTTTLDSLAVAPEALREHYLGGGIKTILTA